jgi:hypothetical protein
MIRYPEVHESIIDYEWKRIKYADGSIDSNSVFPSNILLDTAKQAEQNTDAWKELRRYFITSSNIADALPANDMIEKNYRTIAAEAKEMFKNMHSKSKQNIKKGTTSYLYI